MSAGTFAAQTVRAQDFVRREFTVTEFHSFRRFADREVDRVAYVECGIGPAAIFLHGYPQERLQPSMFAAPDVERPDAADIAKPDRRKGSHMTKLIFVNLPVTNLPASVAFYEALGFQRNPHFSDETAVSLIWSDAIQIMLHTHDKWRTFTNRPIPPKSSSEVMLALGCDSRAAVDAMNDAASANGGTADINPKKDYGFLYNRNLADLDGHVWEAVWMDPSAIPG